MLEIWTDKNQYFTGEASISYGDIGRGDVCTIKSIEIDDIEIQLENNEPYLYEGTLKLNKKSFLKIYSYK